MNLHQDKEAFRQLIDLIHQRTGYRTDVLEKDYYVVLILKELAEMQNDGLPAYFKGGTALYKALKVTKRFSEDIDISVETRGCSRSQNGKLLERATKRYVGLERDASQGKTNRSEVITMYTYSPIVDYDQDDVLQRFGKLKVEATSFTISEPVECLEISALLFEHATSEEREILQNQYDVAPFSIRTISLERVFIDKLFAAEAYFRKSENMHRAFEMSKHIYDLYTMLQHPRIRAFLKDEKEMKYLLDMRMTEEKERLDGIPGVIPQEFTFFEDFSSNQNIKSAYLVMQEQYVLQDKDKVSLEEIQKAMIEIKKVLLQNHSWEKYEISNAIIHEGDFDEV